MVKGLNLLMLSDMFLSGGERMPPDLMEFTKKTFQTVFVSYGATEVLCISYNISSAETEDETNIRPGVELKVVDSDGSVVLRGTAGDIFIRSAFTLNSYLYDPEKTASVKGSAEWVDIGDIGIVHPSGYLEIVGRSRDVISRACSKIHPKTIEKLLTSCPKVDNVIVMGVPDPRLFQEVCAFVILKEGQVATELELEEFCRANVLSGIGVVPRYYVILDGFPMGVTGKFDRLALFEMAIEKFNL